MRAFFGKKFPKTRYEIWHRRGKSTVKGQSSLILYILPSFKFLLYQVLNKKSVKLGSSKILPAPHTYPSVELISTGTIIASTIMVDAFNNDASLYVVPTYQCYHD